MNLFLLRHGIAGEPDPFAYPDDSKRPLTAEGIEKMKGVARAIKKSDLGIEAIYSSPYKRTRETAEIVATQLGLESKLFFSAHLACGGLYENVFSEAEKNFLNIESLMLVGHEPHLSDLISKLVWGDASGMVNMKKGSLCKLEIDQYKASGRCAVLKWLLTPRQMLGL